MRFTFRASFGAVVFWGEDGQQVGSVQAGTPEMAALVREIGAAMSAPQKQETPKMNWFAVARGLGRAVWIVIAALVVLCFGLWTLARAHGWYEPSCCSGRDCARMAFEEIGQTREGYVLDLEPGDHPMITRAQRYVVPYGDRRIKLSQDGFFHVCILAHSQTLACFYEPLSG